MEPIKLEVNVVVSLSEETRVFFGTLADELIHKALNKGALEPRSPKSEPLSTPGKPDSLAESVASDNTIEADPTPAPTNNREGVPDATRQKRARGARKRKGAEPVDGAPAAPDAFSVDSISEPIPEAIPEAIPEDTPEVPSKSDKPVHIDDLRMLLASRVVEHRDAIKAKLKELGASCVTVLDPAKYGDMMDFLNQL